MDFAFGNFPLIINLTINNEENSKKKILENKRINYGVLWQRTKGKEGHPWCNG